jgi:hypothetical protein
VIVLAVGRGTTRRSAYRSIFMFSLDIGRARAGVSPGLFSVAGAVAGGLMSVSALISAPASTMMVDNDGNERRRRYGFRSLPRTRTAPAISPAERRRQWRCPQVTRRATAIEMAAARP